MKEKASPLITALREQLPRGKRVLVAVSGGLDSVSLLHGLVSQQKVLKLVIEVAHIDHGIRAESSSDAQFVAELAARYGVPCHLHRATPPRGAKRENLEAWGRKIRYDFFSQILTAQKLDCILTAHTANDVAEGLLMRLVSNKELRSIAEEDPRRLCLRPLLQVTRKEIAAYAKKHRLEAREDSTNSDLHYLRNRVRHRLLPLLELEFERDSVGILAHRAVALERDLSALDELAESFCLAHLSKNERKGERRFSREFIAALRSLPYGMQWRVMQCALLPIVGYKIGDKHGARVVKFIHEGGARSGRILELPRGRLRRLKGEVFANEEPPGSSTSG